MPNYNCPENTTVTPDNSTLPCDGVFISDECVVHANSISFLTLPANSTTKDVLNAMIAKLIDLNNRVTALEE